MRFVPANTATAAYRRVYFDLRAADGLTAATGEAGGQPQISSDGAAWTNTGIGTLSAIGNGRYYADLTQAAVLTAGTYIQTRYKSANTVETPGESILVIAYNPYDSIRLGLTALPAATPATTGGLPVIGTGANAVSTDGSGNINANVTLWRNAVPNTLVSSRVDCSVGTMQAGTINVDAFQNNCITAAALAPSCITSQEFDATAINAIADQVWDELRSGHVTAGSFGEGPASVQGNVTGNVGGNVTGSVGSVTGNVGGNVTGSVGSVTGNVGGNVTGSVGSLNTQAKADVNAEVVDVLFTDTISQLAQAQPAATPTVAQALMLLYMALRNESTSTSSTLTIKNASGTVICKATLSDDTTTFTKSILVTGP